MALLPSYSLLKIQMDIYQAAIRPFLFSGLKADPELLHHQAITLLSWFDRTSQIPASWARHQLQQTCSCTDARLAQKLWGLTFSNPIGLAAGFDKDGIASGIWPYLGFGFAEMGTVTLHSQPGNPRPRLFRLLEDKAVLNRMGFNNQGAAAMADTLRQRWGEPRQPQADDNTDDPNGGITSTNLSATVSTLLAAPLGINLGKSKITPLEEAAGDYLGSFRLLQAWGDYFVVNVSSPNTPGLRSLQATENLAPILAALQQENHQQKPLLVKIAPDLQWEDISAVLELAEKYHLAGIIATNTTISRDGLKTQTIPTTGNSVQVEAGGISGAPLRQRSTEIIRFIHRETGGKLPIIGVGGIATATDAWEKITAGASLLQIYTGWVYEGPWMVKRILAGLVTKLEERGLTSITEAIGAGDVL